MKKITIGMFTDSFFPMVDGVAMVVDNYAKRLEKIANVIVFCPNYTDKEVDDSKYNYKVVRCFSAKIPFIDYNLPTPKLDLKFKDSESGSSGGLMLTLTIYNALTDDDIIKGRTIAGTGTISYDGSVGEIDGVKYKIMGAASNNVDIVFVPSGNYEEAIDTKNKYHYDMEIISVDYFDEVVEYLSK